MKEKETFFVEKIFKGIKKCFTDNSYYDLGRVFNENEVIIPYEVDIDIFNVVKPKLHTIREDKNDRWQVGTIIDFFINVRQKSMFRFAPRLPVVSVQNIEIIYVPFGDKKQDARPFVKVDGRLIYDVGQTLWSQMKEFAENDGFNTIEDFFAYFDKDFTGKLIHWTDLKY
jgi:hypothetical protein